MFIQHYTAILESKEQQSELRVQCIVSTNGPFPLKQPLQRNKKQKREQKAMTEGRREQTECHNEHLQRKPFATPRNLTAGIEERS